MNILCAGNKKNQKKKEKTYNEFVVRKNCQKKEKVTRKTNRGLKATGLWMDFDIPSYIFFIFYCCIKLKIKIKIYLLYNL